MRNIFSFLLLCLILENVITGNTVRGKISSRIKSIRKLENTDEVETTEEPLPPGNYIPTSPTEAESGDASANGTSVTDNKPVSTQGTENDKKTATVQILKFHGFSQTQRKLSFNVFFYFLKRAISRRVFFRLRITYSSRVRNLAEDSVPSTCDIVDDSLVGTVPQEGDTTNVDYNCNAEALQDGTIANVSLNTDIKMQLSKDGSGESGYESLDFDGINFNGNSGVESQNINANTKKVSTSGSLKNTEATVEKTTLKLTGTLDPSSLLNGKSTIPLSILTENDDGDMVNVEYDCSIAQTTPTCELDCDTSSNPLQTTAGNLHLSTGTASDGTLLTVYMKNGAGNSTDIISTTGSGTRYTYNKSSSGLSGGAIAGIVIACVAVLLAVSIAALMLRKPAAPPIDNSTISGLKVVENV